MLNNPATLTDPLGLQENDCTFANGCRQPRFNDAVSSSFGCQFGMGVSCAHVSAQLLEEEAAYVARITAAILASHTQGGTVSLPDGTTRTWVPTGYSTGVGPGGQAVFGLTTGHWEVLNGPGPVNYEQWTLSLNPVAYALAGFSLTVTHDQRGKFHLTPAVNIGKGMPIAGWGFSWTEGWMNNPNQNLEGFLSGWGCSYGAQAGWLGETHEFSKGGKGTSTTFIATPQAGISCGYTF